METGTWKVKTGLAQMLKGGVIMDVVTPEHVVVLARSDEVECPTTIQNAVVCDAHGSVIVLGHGTDWCNSMSGSYLIGVELELV